MKPHLSETKKAKFLIMLAAMIFVALFLVLPLFIIFAEALRGGYRAYIESVTEVDSMAAIKLTLLVTAIAVPLNVIFGVASAWAITKFDFKFKTVLITIIELPFSISPVIAGFIFVLIFGSNTMLGRYLIANNYPVIYALPGLVIATIFVTLPFVARELIPLMEEQGTQEEEAAIMLGASGLRTFASVTLPNIKWGILYGVLLCTARAMGEFGAVSVVSGHIRGVTNTVPLHVEVLYNEYNFIAAFAVASVLTIMALITLAAKTYIEWKYREGED